MLTLQIEKDNTEALTRLFLIHDEMPLEWNPSHLMSSERRAKLLIDVKTDGASHGFWILTKDGSLNSSFEGILWAKVKASQTSELCCYINSLWIHKDHREKNFAPLLTNACFQWAKKLGATLVECGTHTQNTRMRGILEKNGYAPGMIQYTSKL